MSSTIFVTSKFNIGIGSERALACPWQQLRASQLQMTRHTEAAKHTNLLTPLMRGVEYP